MVPPARALGRPIRGGFIYFMSLAPINEVDDEWLLAGIRFVISFIAAQFLGVAVVAMILPILMFDVTLAHDHIFGSLISFGGIINAWNPEGDSIDSGDVMYMFSILSLIFFAGVSAITWGIKMLFKNQPKFTTKARFLNAAIVTAIIYGLGFLAIAYDQKDFEGFILILLLFYAISMGLLSIYYGLSYIKDNLILIKQTIFDKISKAYEIK